MHEAGSISVHLRLVAVEVDTSVCVVERGSDRLQDSHNILIFLVKDVSFSKTSFYFIISREFLWDPFSYFLSFLEYVTEEIRPPDENGCLEYDIKLNLMLWLWISWVRRTLSLFITPRFALTLMVVPVRGPIYGSNRSVLKLFVLDSTVYTKKTSEKTIQKCTQNERDSLTSRHNITRGGFTLPYDQSVNLSNLFVYAVSLKRILSIQQLPNVEFFQSVLYSLK